jgi:iron complex transport system substrate-binding protein
VAISLAISREAFLLGTRILIGTKHRRIFAVAIAGALFVMVASLTFARTRVAGQNVARSNSARVVTDEVGREVSIPAEVKRIVTLAPNLTETVYALGLEDRLAGDTDYCDTPSAAKSKPHVGNPQNPSLEAILALHPDLVLASTSINRLETADALTRLGIAVYTTDPQTVRGMLESTAHMAEVMGAAQQGTDLVRKMQQRLDALHAKFEDQRMVHVLFVVWEDPLMTIGQNTFIADALRWAGAESIVLSKQKWPTLSLEEVVRLQPDYIVFTSDHGAGPATQLADLRARPAWRDLDAVERGHVVDVSEEVVRPSPGLVDAIEQLARELHPEASAAEIPIGQFGRSSETRVLIARSLISRGREQCAR